MEVIFDASSHV
jgi:hypothetical protein